MTHTFLNTTKTVIKREVDNTFAMTFLQCRSTMTLVAVGLGKNVATTLKKRRFIVPTTSHVYSSLRDRGRTTVARPSCDFKLLLGWLFLIPKITTLVTSIVPLAIYEPHTTCSI